MSVVVGILTYRGYNLTRACLESLMRTSGWPVPVVVVDNASGTGEGQRISEEFGPAIEVVTLDSNVGVAGGYNAILSWAAARGADHVLLANNDTLFSDPNMLQTLVEAAGPGVAAAGPVVRRADGTVQFAGGRISWRTGRAIGSERPAGATPFAVEWLDGSCLLVALGAAKQVGGLAPEFFMYWEEVDWCVRARRAGFRLMLEPRASITHLGSATVTGRMALRYWMRNKILFVRRHGRLRDTVTTIVSLLLRTVPFHVGRGGWSPRHATFVVRTALSAVAWNVRDAVANRSWRRPPLGPSIGVEGATDSDR